MSLYCTIETQFKSPEALVLALMETGLWTAEQIEIHSEPQNLFGYHGDLRPEKANIIIRRKNISNASNDIGFVQENGIYKAIISEYDGRKYNKSWVDKLKQSYSFYAIKFQQEKLGRKVVRTNMPDNRIRVEVRGYR